MVNLAKTRVNRNLGTSGGIVESLPSLTRPPDEHVGRRARIAAGRVLPLTKRPACLFSAPDVACQPRSGILAMRAASPPPRSQALPGNALPRRLRLLFCLRVGRPVSGGAARRSLA